MFIWQSSIVYERVEADDVIYPKIELQIELETLPSVKEFLLQILCKWIPLSSNSEKAWNVILATFPAELNWIELK